MSQETNVLRRTGMPITVSEKDTSTAQAGTGTMTRTFAF